jgi:hypothetical protein
VQGRCGSPYFVEPAAWAFYEQGSSGADPNSPFGSSRGGKGAAKIRAQTPHVISFRSRRGVFAFLILETVEGIR